MSIPTYEEFFGKKALLQAQRENRFYKKGVTHGLEIAWQLMQKYPICNQLKNDMTMACNTALQYRLDRDPHPQLMDDVLGATRAR